MPLGKRHGVRLRIGLRDLFGNLYGAIRVATSLSYIGGALLLDATSTPLTFVAAGSAGTLVTVRRR